MRTTNLKIGKVYYMQAKYQPTNYTSGVLIEILSGNSVLMEDKEGNKYKCNAGNLHKRPDKAVRGIRAQERVRQEVKEKKLKEEKAMVDKSIQQKIKRLGHSAYATIKNGKYIVYGYSTCKSFLLASELEEWVDEEYEKIKSLEKKYMAERKV